MNLILDIDGTLSDAEHRAHYVNKDIPDWQGFLQPNLVGLDTVIEGSQRGFEYLSKIATKVYFLTGRNESLREVTAKWLHDNFKVNKLKHVRLIMRPLNDNRLPTTYKDEALVKIKAHSPRVTIAIDDDKFMMKVYRDHGFIALHAPECWKTMFPDFDHLTNETAWRR